MPQLTGYHEKAVELSTELVKHGFGSMSITVETLKDKNKTKVVVDCGKTYVFFIRRNSFSEEII